MTTLELFKQIVAAHENPQVKSPTNGNVGRLTHGGIVSITTTMAHKIIDELEAAEKREGPAV